MYSSSRIATTTIKVPLLDLEGYAGKAGQYWERTGPSICYFAYELYCTDTAKCKDGANAGPSEYRHSVGAWAGSTAYGQPAQQTYSYYSFRDSYKDLSTAYYATGGQTCDVYGTTSASCNSVESIINDRGDSYSVTRTSYTLSEPTGLKFAQVVITNTLYSTQIALLSDLASCFATTKSISGEGGTNTSTGTGIVSPQNAQSAKGAGLSPDEQAGIGAGIGVAVLILIALGAAFFFLRRRKHKARHEVASNAKSHVHSEPKPGVQSVTYASELHSNCRAPNELDAYREFHELKGEPFVRHELPVKMG